MTDKSILTIIMTFLAVATILQGCSMKGYDSRSKEESDIMRDIRKVFVDAPSSMLYHETYREYKITNLRPGVVGSRRHSLQATLTNATHRVTHVVFKLSGNRRSETILEVEFTDSTFTPIHDENSNSEQRTTSTNRSATSDDARDNVQRIAEQMAERIAQREIQEAQRKFDEDLKSAKRKFDEDRWAMHADYDKRVRKLSDSFNALKHYILPALSNYAVYSSGNNNRHVDEWLKRNHLLIQQHKELFRDFIMFSAMNSHTANLFRHYQEIAGHFNVRFTLHEVYLYEYPELSELPDYENEVFVKPHKGAIRAHLGKPLEDSDGLLVYEDFTFTFDADNNLQSAELH